MEGKGSKRALFLEEKGIEQSSELAKLFSRIILKDRCADQVWCFLEPDHI